MTDGVTVADFVTAAAALTPAALSGATLYVTGRRGELRWRRDALIDALEGFANMSFARSSTAFRTVRARRGQFDEPLWQACSDRLDDSRREHEALTRIRLLGELSTIRAAEALMFADAALADLAKSSRPLPTPDELDRLDVLRRRRDGS